MPLDDLQPGQTSKQFATIQAKNLEYLTNILGSKEALETLTELGKIDKTTWKDIRHSIVSIADFATAGGLSGFKEEMKTIIQENVQGALGPLYNELQPIMDEMMRALQPLMPFIVDLVKWGTDILIPIIQWIADRIQDIINYFTGFGQDELVLLDGEWVLRSQLPPFAIQVGPVEYISPGRGEAPAGGAGEFTGPTAGGRRVLDREFL